MRAIAHVPHGTRKYEDQNICNISTCVSLTQLTHEGHGLPEGGVHVLTPVMTTVILAQ